MAIKKKNYDETVDYQRLINEAVAQKNYSAAAGYEQQRNEKISGEGLDYQQTNVYSNFLNTPAVPKAPVQAKKPSYTSQYQGQIDNLLNQVLNQKAFSYNKDNDDLYKQYADTYTREGNRAMQDTLGKVASTTGGLASSYATSAAQQANNYYMQQLADKVPELEGIAYGRYRDDAASKLQNLGVVQGIEQSDYGRYRDGVGDFYQDQNFNYQKYLDELSQSNYQSEVGYKQGQDALSQSNYLGERDYKKMMDELAQGNYESEFAYQQSQDKLAQQNYLNDVARAQANRGSGGGTRSGGGTQEAADFETAFQSVKESGNPELWLLQNSGALGLDTANERNAFLTAYSLWEKEQSANALPAQIGNSNGNGWVSVPGLGRLGEKELQSAIDRGEVTVTQSADGKLYFRKS